MKTLPAELKKAHPEVPWPSIAGLRAVVVHEYFRVDLGLVRDTLDEPVTRLAAAIDSDGSGATRP